MAALFYKCFALLGLVSVVFLCIRASKEKESPALLLPTNWEKARSAEACICFYFALHRYQYEVGNLPKKNDAELSASLSGKNRLKINFINEFPELIVDHEGRLVAPNGVPYSFRRAGDVIFVYSQADHETIWGNSSKPEGELAGVVYQIQQTH